MNALAPVELVIFFHLAYQSSKNSDEVRPREVSKFRSRMPQEVPHSAAHNRQPPAVYRFGAYQVDSQSLTLSHRGVALPLAPKVVKTLVVLLDNPRSVVSKDELLQSVWSGELVDEANLSQNIYTLRRTFEAKGDVSFIETLSRRGYRFTVEVSKSPLGSSPSARPVRLVWLGVAAAVEIRSIPPAERGRLAATLAPLEPERFDPTIPCAERYLLPPHRPRHALSGWGRSARAYPATAGLVRAARERARPRRVRVTIVAWRRAATRRSLTTLALALAGYCGLRWLGHTHGTLAVGGVLAVVIGALAGVGRAVRPLPEPEPEPGAVAVGPGLDGPYPIADAHTRAQAADCVMRAARAEGIELRGTEDALRTPWGWQVPVILRRGTPAGLITKLGELETTLDLPAGGLLAAPDRPRQARVVLRLAQRDPFTGLPPAINRPPASGSIREPQVVGARMDGTDLALCLLGVHAVVIGVSGAGKSQALRTLAELDPAVQSVNGYTRYRVEGDVSADQATVHVIDKGGAAATLPSRTDADPRLRGTKHRVANQREVTAVRGRADDRTLIIVPEVKHNETVGITLLHVTFVDHLSAEAMRGVLEGYQGRYSALKDAVTETETRFDDSLLAEIPVIELLTEPVYVLADRWRKS